ncbi:sporulation protein SsgA [Streptomyces sp. MBT67]|uniref:plasmid transfer protein TraB n=1 Tax=unclassified Streptomyces TaxID=2593676 RepID=UPI00190A3A0A|nr:MULTISPECIES: plasmid transfer protein TraB [unclassified Streptomyces]MBK3539500.1 sporulation protein SsgA [Streptomyces sp. MBT67]MBK3646853.1 sporulation protein SsgA [Streptomyces sp. MBT33]
MTSKDAAQQQEDRLNSGSSASGMGSWLWHRAKPYTPPWIVTGAVGLTGAGANTLWSESPWAGVGLTLASVGLTAATWWAGKSTGQQRRLHSAITVAAGSSWFTAAALSGPLTGPLPDLYLMGGATLALTWNIRQVMRSSVSETSGSDSDKGLLEKVGLARTRLRDVKVEPNRVTVPYELPAGELTNDDVAKAIPRIASALDVPTTAIRVMHDPDSARKGQFVIVPEDMLKTPTVWPGPFAPGESVAVPLRLGVYDDGSDLLLPLLDAIHLLVMGMTGSGKTEGALDILLEILTRNDVAVWLADAAKAGQDFQPLIPGMDWAALDTPSAGAMVAAVQAVIPARTAWLRDHSYRAWEPAAARTQTNPAHSCAAAGACGCPGMPYLLAWFEEAAKLLRELGDDVFTGIAQEARSAGVSLVVSMQRASGYQLSTDTRASLPAAMCFGVKGDDASFALPEEVLDAGANPAAWGNKRKGYVYLVSAGVEEDLYANPARTFWTGPPAEGTYERMARYVVEHFANVRAELDPVTAAAAERVAGTLFTGRRERATGAPLPAAAAPAPELTEEQESAREVAALVDAEDAELDASAELPDVAANAQFPEAKPPSTEEARELLDEMIRMLASVGPGTVAVRDVTKYLDRIGRDRSWVSKEMKKLSEEGRLAATGEQGVYRLIPTMAGV